MTSRFLIPAAAAVLLAACAAPPVRPDLTPAQVEEVGREVGEFVENRKLDGLHCVVILTGRGLSKTAYSQDTAPLVPTMLAAAYRAARDYNAAREN